MYPIEIIYDPDIRIKFYEYGITIPMKDTRFKSVMEFLKTKGALPSSIHTQERAAELLCLGSPSEIITRADLERAHSPEYVASLYDERLTEALLTTFELLDEKGNPHRYEPQKAAKPLSDMFGLLRRNVLGTYLAARLALERGGMCLNFGGGMHHGRYYEGAGFCLINDIMITARKLLQEGLAELIWIIDADAHKGDGSAELARVSRARGETFSGKNPEIITLSIHMAQGWPLDAETLGKLPQGRDNLEYAPLCPSDIEIPIEEGEEGVYAQRLRQGFEDLKRLTGERKPSLAIVLDGADVYEKDGLPSSAPLKLTLEQCLERDMLIKDFLETAGVPSAWVTAGGYGEHAWEPTAHFLKGLLLP